MRYVLCGSGCCKQAAVGDSLNALCSCHMVCSVAGRHLRAEAWPSSVFAVCSLLRCVCVSVQGDDLNMMMPESPPHPGDQEMISNDEAHDQLGDLPFNGGTAIACSLNTLCDWFYHVVVGVSGWVGASGGGGGGA
jgi:hypothetical protein